MADDDCLADDCFADDCLADDRQQKKLPQTCDDQKRGMNHRSTFVTDRFGLFWICHVVVRRASALLESQSHGGIKQ